MTFHLRKHDWPPLHVDISAAVTLKAAFYGTGFGRANTVISRTTQVASKAGPRWSRQEGRSLCTGRHDPITCLGSEGAQTLLGEQDKRLVWR